MQIVTKDGTTIDVMPETVPAQHIVCQCASRTAFNTVWGKLAASKDEYEVYEDGEKIGTVHDAEIVGTQTNVIDDVMYCHFYMKGGWTEAFVDLTDEETVDPEETEGTEAE